MTDSQDFNENDATLAAEYVVGLLPIDTRNAVEIRLRTDRAFADLVLGWQDHFAGLNRGYGSVKPPRRVKNRIDQRLFPSARRSWARWIPAGLAASVFVVLLSFGVLQSVLGIDPDLTARLENAQSGYSFEIEVASDGSDIDVALLAGILPDSRVFELWIVPDGAAPRSLGTFQSAGQLQATDGVSLVSGATLAVSIEPEGGSPTGAPTGPVVAAGTLSDV